MLRDHRGVTQLPQSREAIVATGQRELAVGGDIERRDPIIVLENQRSQLFAGRYIPLPASSIATCGDESSIASEAERCDRAAMSFQHGGSDPVATLLLIQNNHAAIITACQDFPIRRDGDGGDFGVVIAGERGGELTAGALP